MSIRGAIRILDSITIEEEEITIIIIMDLEVDIDLELQWEKIIIMEEIDIITKDRIKETVLEPELEMTRLRKVLILEHLIMKIS